MYVPVRMRAFVNPRRTSFTFDATVSHTVWHLPIVNLSDSQLRSVVFEVHSDLSV